MQITRLELRNFGIYEHRVFDFTKPRIFLVGNNGAGKSTVLDAIRWLLTGHCASLDGSGRGVESLLRSGAPPELEVSANLEINGETFLARRFWGTGGTDFKLTSRQRQMDGTSSDLQAALYLLLNTTDSALSVALDAEPFLRANHADAKALLLTLINPTCVVPETNEKITVAEAEHRYDTAYEKRTGVNRAIKAIGTLVAPSEEVGDLAGAREKLARLEQQVSKLRNASAVSSGELSAFRDEDERLAKREKIIRDRIENARTKANWPEHQSGQELLDRASRLDQDAMADRTLCAKKNKAINDAILAAAQSPAETEADLLKRIDRHEPSKGCVLHPDIPCKTAQTQFTMFVKKHKGKADDTTGPTLADLVAERDEVLKRVQKADREIAIFVACGESIKVATPDLEEVTGRREELAKILASADTETADPNMGQIEELQARINRGNEVIAKKLRLEGEWKQYWKQETTLTELKAEQKQIEADVKLYGPNGIRANALSRALDGFVAEVNGPLSTFGYKLTIAVDPWVIRINDRPVSRLSKSEWMRVATSFQLAVAVWAKIGLTLVDSVDWLLSEHRKKLAVALDSVALSQVILAKAQEPGVPLVLRETVNQVIEV